MLEVRCSSCGAKMVLGDEEKCDCQPIGKHTAEKMEGTVYLETEKDMWDKARIRAIKIAEAEHKNWEDIGKYERQDLVFAQFEKVKEENKGEKKMVNLTKEIKGETKMVSGKSVKKDERMEALKAMGLNVDALPAGFDVESLFTKRTEDPVMEKIYANGHIKAAKTHKRKLPAQYIGLLGWFNGSKSYDDWTENLRKTHDMNYAIDFLSRHIHHMAKLQASDTEEFEKENFFISLGVCKQMFVSYMEQFKIMINEMPRKDFHGVQQIKFGKDYINESAIEAIIFKPLDRIVERMQRVSNFRDMEYLCNQFLHHKNFRWLSAKPVYDKENKVLVKSGVYMQMPNYFIEAYKGAGAYYTAQDVIRFDGVRVNGMDAAESERELDRKTDEYGNDFFCLHAWVKQLLLDNNFNLSEVIKNK